MKICPSKKCIHKGKWQPTTNFYKKPMTKDGLTEECIDCRSVRQKEYTEKKKRDTKDFFNMIIG